MKNFFTSMFGALVALIIFFAGGALVMFIVFAAIAAAGRSEKPVHFENGSYLTFNTSVNITDAPPPFDKAALARLFGGDEEAHTVQLRQLTKALHAAAKDSRISGVFMTGNLAHLGYGGYLYFTERTRCP